MLKKLLFITTIIGASSMLAQNLELRDSFDVSIDGHTYYLYGTASELDASKFHVENHSNGDITFECSLWEMANSFPSDWQICFGSKCQVASKNTPTAQTFASAVAPASGVYDDLKIAPFSDVTNNGWTTGDWGVWRVRVFDASNPIDSSTCYVVWTAGGKPTGDSDGNGVINGTEIGGDIDENGVIDGSEITGDMNGDGVINPWEVSGDTNGNGVIDNGEILSIVEFDKSNVHLSAYPNPVLNNLIVNYSIEGNINSAKIDVYDILGQKINTYTLSNKKGQLMIDVEGLNSGVYFYTIKVDEKTIKTERVIIK